ncbi:toll/interleukin-1 receptor domain-containing protein [Lentzea flaviverrucosa]|uniref:TIR domain-containing protein n=1 Tax=Lentzea flaviverrucosa TaxID=200379 RepID=A0A1H9ME10_9PSEU|nr:toll/interleukin-1 receptor domain-containing protein [Lentzea flaviverrucosa]RDI30959.1 TIR domain-containing protein [Lentzea flaviverrucosa]SER21811.1 TIR domain-containing protein [Lentzea flaviverrucosa]
MLHAVHDVASKLLAVSSFQDVCLSVLNRCMLDNGRFEAGRFGRGQHSSASAGAVLNGVVSIPCVPARLRQRVRRLGCSLLTTEGHLRGHDEHPGDGTTSWSLAQVLHGIAKDSTGQFLRSANFANGLTRLLALQNRSDGSWPLRRGDFDDPVFAFYPVLLFEQLSRTQGPYAEYVQESIRLTADYLLDVASATNGTIADAALAVSALDRIFRLGRLDDRAVSRYFDHKARLISDLVDETGNLHLTDKYIQNDLQPRWHSVTWTPVLYACTRHWGGVQSSHNFQISARLIESFDRTESGWKGPSHSPGRASSWASSLALLNVYLLARDIVTSGLDVTEYQNTMRSMSARKRFDVVISFGGPDRAVAREIRDHLVAAGLRVFFDTDFRHDLLGEDLAILLQDIYFERSRFAIAILSRSFLKSDWAGNWEWKAVLARMNKQRQGYLLPYFLENVEVPGLNPTIGFLSADKVSPCEFADIVVRKVQAGRRP